VGAVHHNALRQYRRNRIATAGPGQLIVMVYDGIISCLANAAQALEAGNGEKADIPLAHDQLVKAQRLLEELQLSLDSSVEELGPMLEELYAVLMRDLMAANINKDVEAINMLREQFSELRASWAQVIVDAGSGGQP